LGFHLSCIYEWLAKYREGGIEALKTKTISGRDDFKHKIISDLCSLQKMPQKIVGFYRENHVPYIISEGLEHEVPLSICLDSTLYRAVDFLSGKYHINPFSWILQDIYS
jgi:hypothetical protein